MTSEMHSEPADPIIDVLDLNVTFPRPGGGTRQVVDNVSLSAGAGQCLALIGESGSGKSVTAKALIGLCGVHAGIRATRLRLAGHDIATATDKQLRHLRGRAVGLVQQDALVSLDPLRPIGKEITDSLKLHTTLGARQRQQRCIEALDAVGIDNPRMRFQQRPGELSGGQRQRALIAAALVLDPRILIADEPTTALDATVQAQVVDLLLQIKHRGTTILLISHDLAVAASIADNIAVMKDGQVIEQGRAHNILHAPEVAYTRWLLDAVPTATKRGQFLGRTSTNPVVPKTITPPRSGDTSTVPLLVVDSVSKNYRVAGYESITAASDISFEVASGRTIGVVGESGSGKSTLAKMILGLAPPDTGSIKFVGRHWSGISERERRPLRHRMAAITQDPLSSFDPRWRVGEILDDALTIGHPEAGAKRPTISDLLGQVGLGMDVSDQRPLRLSGGQRQRVAIARALAGSPDLVVCDEPVSALDVSIQAEVLDLLLDIQQRTGVSYLFVSHDLAVVHHLCDEIIVMKSGRIVEKGSAAAIFQNPDHPYTRQLFASSPALGLSV